MIQLTNVRQVCKVAIRECQRQGLGFRSLIDLLSAYEVAYFAFEKGQAPTIDRIKRVAQLIDPVNNDDLRNTPVEFEHLMGKTCPVDLVSQAVADWSGSLEDSWNMNLFDPENKNEYRIDMIIQNYVRQLLWIHPFKEGNERLAWIVFNWLKGCLDYPMPLPDCEL